MERHLEEHCASTQRRSWGSCIVNVKVVAADFSEMSVSQCEICTREQLSHSLNVRVRNMNECSIRVALYSLQKLYSLSNFLSHITYF